MTENEWTKSIAEKLAAEITPLRIETQKKRFNAKVCGIWDF